MSQKIKNLGKYKYRSVGKSVEKIDSISLSTGKAKFFADYIIPDTAHVKFLYSKHAHAEILSIDTTKAEKIDGVIYILHHENTEQIPHTTAGQGFPEPSPYDSVMFDKTMRFVGDKVAAVLAETPEIAEEACNKIKVKYKILPALFDYEIASDKGSPIIHCEKTKKYPIPIPYSPNLNIAAEVDINIGNLEEGLSESDYYFDETFYTHYSSHAMLEPHGVITYLDETGRLVIITATQVPFHVRRICAMVLNIPIKQIRVIKPRIGGGFGGKQEVFLEYIAALFTLKTNRPAKISLSRKDVFRSSRTRHPMRVNIRCGVKKNGHINAFCIDALMNTGAYGSHALTVLSNAGSKVLPLINKAEHQRFIGKSVYTNLPVGGAYRGYGATQSYFAVGQVMDIMARKLNIDLIEFYSQNNIKKGETSPIFEKLGEGKEGVKMIVESCGLEECIKKGVEAIDWYAKRDKQIEKNNKVHGVGMVCLMQGSGIPRIDMGSAYIKMNEDGSFNLHIGATDIGTGSDTILAQIAAEAIGTDIDEIIVLSSDTDLTPFDVGAYASSTTYISGQAVRKCGLKIKKQILEVASEITNQNIEELEILNKKVQWNNGSLDFSEICSYALYTNNQFQIQATASNISNTSPPPFSAHFAEVAVDKETGEIEIIKYVTTVDCGTAINPKLAEGQVEGAVVNGISWALTEEYRFNKQGGMINADFGRYKIYTSIDIPNMETILIPTHEPTGPYGAKSVSEIAINGPGPAIANAIYDAIGVRIHSLPIKPEKILELYNKKNN